MMIARFTKILWTDLVHRPGPAAVGRTRRGLRWAGVCVAIGATAGCSSPPSVAPLLRLSREAIHAEVQHLQGDTALQQTLLEQHRRALEDAFDADLKAAGDNGTLDTAWVREATRVYTLARETLADQRLKQEQAYAQRIDNLAAAAEAQERAIAVLERRDELLQRVWG